MKQEWSSSQYLTSLLRPTFHVPLEIIFYGKCLRSEKVIACLLSEHYFFSEMFNVLLLQVYRIMIMYVHQKYYIISEQVFVQTYKDIYDWFFLV